MEIFLKIKTYKYKYDVIWFLLIPILNIFYLITGSLYSKGHNISTILDYKIPFLPIFIFPYVYWYIYMFIGFIIINIKDRHIFIKAFTILIAGMLSCYIIYAIFPTEFPRPIIKSDGLLNTMVLKIYSADKPFNCFPSLHVLGTYIIMRHTSFNKKSVIFYHNYIIGTLIVLSTLFIKQHFVLDIFGSIILAEILIFIFKKISIGRLEGIYNIFYKDKSTEDYSENEDSLNC